ncbi:MAG TPA: hypothetical protein VI454_10850 [Verrucomicrobiae bacterium]
MIELKKAVNVLWKLLEGEKISSDVVDAKTGEVLIPKYSCIRTKKILKSVLLREAVIIMK